MAYPAELLSVVETAYLDHFGVTPSRASVSFLGVEPIEVLRYVVHDAAGGQPISHYISLGMSRYAMVEPSASVVDEATAPRAELLISVHAAPDQIWRSIAVLAAAPAVEGAVYAEHGRLHLPDPLVSGSRCTGGVLVAGPFSPILLAGIAPIEVMALLPATATELAWSRVHGSEALLERWASERTDLADLTRDAVDLSVP